MREDLSEAINQVRSEGLDLDILIPWDIGDLKRLFADAVGRGADRVLVAGGDGSINGMANLITDRGAQDQIALAVLPLGTANDFARATDIPSDDLSGALRLALTGEETRIDVGLANGRCFVNVASGGLGAEITATTPVELKRALGGAAYSIMGLIKASQLKPYQARIVLPDGQTEAGQMLVVAVGNSRFAGGGFDVAPRACLTDGLLDLSAVTAPRQGGFDRLIDELKDPFNEANQMLHYRQLDSFVIETEQPLTFNLDGEPVVDTRFEFGVRPKHLKMVLGKAF